MPVLQQFFSILFDQVSDPCISLVSRACQSSVRRLLRSDGDFHGAACGGRSQNIVHRLRDIIGLNHLATVELAVRLDPRRVDEAG